jgi:hypothetical protein
MEQLEQVLNDSSEEERQTYSDLLRKDHVEKEPLIRKDTERV